MKKQVNNNLLNYDLPLAELLKLKGFDALPIRLWISKSLFTLTLYKNDKPIKTYPVVLGSDPENDKLMEGDGCTPEGIFRIRNKFPHPKWSRFIWIDYPNDQSWEKHQLSKQNGKIPPNATIGGEIGIHGVPDSDDALVDEGINWTAGCISLKTDDVKEIFEYVSPDTIIEIVK